MATITYADIYAAVERVEQTGDEAPALALLEKAPRTVLREVAEAHGCQTGEGLLEDAKIAVYQAYNYWQDYVAGNEEEAEVVALVTPEAVAAAVKRTDRGMHKVAAIALGLGTKAVIRKMYRPALETLLMAQADRAAVLAALDDAEATVTARRAARAAAAA